VFAALGVFADRFAPDLACTVLQAADIPATQGDIETLAAKSLLQPVQVQGHTRYMMLETIKAFAWQAADGFGLRPRIEPALLHAYHARLVPLRGFGMPSNHTNALAHANRDDSANIERALLYSCRPHATTTDWVAGAEIVVDRYATTLIDGRTLGLYQHVVALAACMPPDVPALACAWFHWSHGACLFSLGRAGESMKVIQAGLLAADLVAPGHERAQVLYALKVELGRALRRIGRLDEAIAVFAEAQSLAEDKPALFYAREPHLNLAEAEYLLGNVARGLEYTARAERTLALFRDAFPTGADVDEYHLRDTARVHNMYGWGYKRQGNYEAARRHFWAAIAIHRDQRDPIGVILTLANVSGIDVLDERLADAEASAQESLAMAQRIGHEDLIMMAVTGLAQVHLRMGQWSRARAGFQQAWDMLGDAHFPVRRGELLVGMGAANVLGGEDIARGAEQLRLGRASFEDNGMQMDQMTAYEYDRAMQDLERTAQQRSG
jgi:tetratricopeptide (TPR) repeat protein